MVKLEKILFLARELEFAFTLANRMPDDFHRRTVARHLIIRAKDFIALTRRFKTELAQQGFKVKKFHEEKETYARYFEEYFQKQRDRLGGHVQDIEFSDRLDLWNDIEVQKLAFFAESARDIYVNRLGELNIPGYTLYSSFPEISDLGFWKTLENKLRSEKSEWAVISSDSLAATRPNTGVALNFTPVHERAGQLALLRKWIKFESSVLEGVTSYPNFVRIMKSRLVTDIVSFGDCLITRPVTVGAPQELVGLIDLITDQPQIQGLSNVFQSNFKYGDVIDQLRLTRNKFGGHFDDDDGNTLQSILNICDRLEVERMKSIFLALLDFFHRVCTNVIYLKHYLFEEQTLRGVQISSIESAIVPFNDKNPMEPPSELKSQDLDSVEEYSRQLDQWLDPKGKHEEAQDYYFNAFSTS